MLRHVRPSDIAVDLGTSKIAVHVRGEGLVATEPAVLAYRGDTLDQRSIIAVGQEALRMIGKTPQGVHVVRPIRDGVVSDGYAAGLILKTMLARHKVGGDLRRRRFLVGTLFGASGMERRAFEQVAESAGALAVQLIEEPLAAAMGAELAIDEPRACMVVDIGGGATEALVISLKRPVAGGSVRVGGETMNAAIASAVRRQTGLLIGEQEARRLHELVASAVDAGEWVEVRGRDGKMHLPRAAVVPVSALQRALQGPVDAMVEMVRGVIGQLSAELSADLVERGAILAGGCATSRIVRRCLEQETGLQMVPIAQPDQAVIKGCARMLDYYDEWLRYYRSSKLS